MAGLLANFRNTMIVSVLIALLFVFAYYHHNAGGADAIFWQAVLRLFHVFSGILWIGLLYYFNFVQIRKMPDIPAEQKPAISKHIAPEALFWFRWAALSTWVFGLMLAFSRGTPYFFGAITLGASEGFHVPQHSLIGLGMWIATIMFLNVWGIIWPNQKRALGIVQVDDAAKAKAGKLAMLASRVNTLLSIPMLVTMTMSQTIFG